MNAKSNNLFKYDIVFENDLNWKQLNEIHYVLNKAFVARTNRFLYLPYAQRKPIARVLCIQNNQVVATSAYFEDYIRFNSGVVRVGGVGLSSSILSGMGAGNKCRHIVATEVTKIMGTEICISRISNKSKQCSMANSLFFGFLNKHMSGLQSRSHDDEFVAVYNTHVSEQITSNYFINYNYYLK